MNRYRGGNNLRSPYGGNSNNNYSSDYQQMNVRQNMPYYQQNYEDYTSDNVGQSSNYDNKTNDQIAFDEEFKRWENSFEAWKKEFSHMSNSYEYEEYEKKFLDVREKLLKKRAQIYGQKSPFSREFETQLSAADAMANSILSKFGGNNNGGGNNFNGSHNNLPMQSRGTSQDRNDFNTNNMLTNLMQLAQTMTQGNMNFNGQNYNQQNQGGRNFQRQNRGMGGGNGFGGGGRGGNFYNRHNNNNFMGGGGQGGTGGQGRNNFRQTNNPFGQRKNNNPINKGKNQNGSPMKRPQNNQNEDKVPFIERIKTLYEAAKVAECPKVISGSINKRVKEVREKKDKHPEKMTADDKFFLEYVDYVHNKRFQFRKQKKSLEETPTADGNTMQNDN